MPATAARVDARLARPSRARSTRARRASTRRAVADADARGTTTFDPASTLRHARVDVGAHGRGLFVTGTGSALVSVAIDALVCAPAAVGEGAEGRAATAIRETYREGWRRHFGVDVPECLIEFVISAPFAKDVRLAAMLAWAVKNAEAWRAYGAEVVPAAFDSAYLANEEELEMLQDAEIRVMAERSKAGYEATWNAAMEAFPDVKAALGTSSEDEIRWCRSWVHTRAISGKMGDTDCAFLAPTIDLANHRVESTAKYGVSADGKNFELTWNEESIEGPTPVANTEVFISYGDRMNNALLMLHYGFIDDENRNERLPMEFIAPGARRVHGSRVADACKALDDAGDKAAALAGSNLLMVASRGPPPGVADAPAPPETDPEVIQALRQAVDSYLSACPTTLAEDEALLASAEAASLSPRALLAVRYRASRKRAAEAYLRFLSILK